MNAGEAFEANAQAPEVMQPSDCAFNDPSGFARATTVRLTSAGDLGRDACMRVAAGGIGVASGSGILRTLAGSQTLLRKARTSAGSGNPSDDRRHR